MELLAINYSSNGNSIAYLLPIIGSMYRVNWTRGFFSLCPKYVVGKFHQNPNLHYQPIQLAFYFMLCFMVQDHCNHRPEQATLTTQTHTHPRLTNLRAPLLPLAYPPLLPSPQNNPGPITEDLVSDTLCGYLTPLLNILYLD